MPAPLEDLHESVRQLAAKDIKTIATALKKAGTKKRPAEAFYAQLLKTAAAVEYGRRKLAEASPADKRLAEYASWHDQLRAHWDAGVTSARTALEAELYAPLAATLETRKKSKVGTRLAALAELADELHVARVTGSAFVRLLDGLVSSSHAEPLGFGAATARMRDALASRADDIQSRLRGEVAGWLAKLGEQRAALVQAADEKKSFALLSDGTPAGKPDLALAALLADLELVEYAAARSAKLALAANLPNVPALDALDRAKDVLRQGLTDYRGWCAGLQQEHIAFGPGPDASALIDALRTGALAAPKGITGFFGLDTRQGPHWLVFPFEEACRRNSLLFIPAAPPAGLAGIRVTDLQKPATARLPLDGARLVFTGIRQETICGECGSELPWTMLLERTNSSRRTPFDAIVRDVLKDKPCCQERVLRLVKCPVCERRVLPQARIAYRARVHGGSAPGAALKATLKEHALLPCCGTLLLTFEDLGREVEHSGFPDTSRALARQLLTAAVIETKIFDPHPRASRPFSRDDQLPFLPALQRPEVYIVPLGKQSKEGAPLFKLGAWGELQRLEGLQDGVTTGKREMDALFEPISRALGTKDI